ncbi:hypothetical protein CAC42_4607 [Sphaceloma murrayae]|uniref:Thioredoxin-like protein AAED1 n=1 Tax=Sphaceloma murrayae TaxID=2082308 RepID=A0A2K1QP61_9PEZI|nr:hypothetical protein CAC42_4607 [Sphaceloma murrayae]
MPSRKASEAGCGCGLVPFSFGKKRAPEGAQKPEPEDNWDEDDLDYDDPLREDSKVEADDDEFQQMPSESLLNDLYKVQIMDKTRRKVPFKDLVRSKDHRRHVVVFVRHFFCGMCYSYVKALAHQMPPERLARLNPPTTLTIVGCGDPILIPKWLEQTDCPYEVYADPSRKLYNQLGFAINTEANAVPPQYVQKFAESFMKNLWRSIGLAASTAKISGGVITQNGGEMIWIDGQLQFIHRMKNSTDHTEVYEMLRLLKRQGQELGRRTPSIRSVALGGDDNSGTQSKRSSWARYIGKRLSIISDKGQ